MIVDKEKLSQRVSELEAHYAEQVRECDKTLGALLECKSILAYMEAQKAVKAVEPEKSNGKGF
jgi:hypothetical protein